MVTFAELHETAHERRNVRKAKQSVALIGRKSEVGALDFPTVFKPGSFPDLSTDTTGLRPLGLVTNDGFTGGREEENEEIPAHGVADAVRTDTTSVSRTLSTTVLEKHRRVIQEIALGADFSGKTVTPGEFLTLDEPEMPMHDEWTIVLILKDGAPGNEIFFGRLLGTVKIQSAGEESWGTEGADQQELTWKAFTDKDYGTPVKHFIGGPGFEALAAELGYELAEPDAWSAETAYEVGDLVALSGGETLQATTAGTSGTTEPTAPATVGDTVTDGTVTWERIS